MKNKTVYIVVNEGMIDGVFYSKEKAEASMREGYPSSYTPEEIEEELEELRQEREYYIDEWDVR